MAEDAPDLTRSTYPFSRETPLDPPGAYEVLRRSGGLSQVELWDGSKVWLATGYEQVRQVLGHPDLSISPTSPGYPFIAPGRQALLATETNNFAFMDPPEHTRLRQMLAGMFTVRHIRAMQPAMERIARRLLEAMLAKGPPADFATDFALPLPSLVIAELLGVPEDDRGFFQSCARRRGKIYSPSEAQSGSQDVFGYLMGLLGDIESHNLQGDTLLHRLVWEQVAPGHITREVAAGMGAALLVAGHQTTASMLTLGTLLLLRHPEQRRALIEEPALLPNAVEETLRYLTIAHQHAARAAAHDIEIDGRAIKEGEGVVASLAAANRDPAEFPDPDVFDMRRNSRNHLAFGYGVHQCLGQILARTELRIAFALLLDLAPGLELAAPDGELPISTDEMVLNLRSLPVRW
jgi:cytochrome P450